MGGGVSIIEQELCRPLDAQDVAASKEEAVKEVQRLRGILADCKQKGLLELEEGGEDYSQYLPSYCLQEPIVTAEMAELMMAQFTEIRSGNSPLFVSQSEETDPMTHFGITFYTNLFAKAPQIRHMFKTPIPEQGSKLAAVLAAAVGLVMKPDVLVPILEDLARSHVGKGTKYQHYGLVGECLIETLQAMSGDSWTDKHYNAWLATYSLMMQVMIPVALKEERLHAQRHEEANKQQLSTEPPSPVGAADGHN